MGATKILTLIAIAAGSSPAFANLQTAQKDGCTACHAVATKVVGPAFQDVSKKYAGQADAAVKIAESIRKGGTGRWGPVPMPPQPQLSEADVKALADWIASGSK